MRTAPKQLGSKHTQPKSRGRCDDKQELTSYRYQRWRRSQMIDANWMCAKCRANGVIELATQLHHIQPRHLRPDLIMDEDNVLPLCDACHEKEHTNGKSTTNQVDSQ